MSKLVLIALADRADDTGRCYPTIATLAEDCECSVRTVERALARLEKTLQVISIERRAIEGMKTSSIYRIDWDAAQSLIVPTQSRNDTTQGRNDASESRSREVIEGQVITDTTQSRNDASQGRHVPPESRNDASQSRSRYDTESYKPPSEPPITTTTTAGVSVPALLTCVRATSFLVTDELLDQLKLLYPAVDIFQELRNMAGWLAAEPDEHRPPPEHMSRFIHRWLKGESRKPGSMRGNGPRSLRDTSLKDDLSDTSWADPPPEGSP